MVGLHLGLVCEGQELLSRCGDAGSGQVGSLLRTSGCTLSLLERQLLSSSDPLGAWHEYVLILGPGEKLSSLMSAMSILT